MYKNVKLQKIKNSRNHILISACDSINNTWINTINSQLDKNLRSCSYLVKLWTISLQLHSEPVLDIYRYSIIHVNVDLKILHRSKLHSFI